MGDRKVIGKGRLPGIRREGEKERDEENWEDGMSWINLMEEKELGMGARRRQ